MLIQVNNSNLFLGHATFILDMQTFEIVFFQNGALHIATVFDICVGFKNNCLPETKTQIANNILRDWLLFGIWMLKATF